MNSRIQTIMERIQEINQTMSGMFPRKNVSAKTKENSESEKTAFKKALDDAKDEVMNIKTGRFSAKNGISPVSSMAPPIIPDLKKATLLYSESKNTFDDLVEKYSNANNIDADLIKRIIQAESGFDPKAISNKGAMGLMQLMPDTAKELGVKKPFDPEENISAGTKYLAEMLKLNNGDLKLALASYNAGPNAVREHAGIPPFPETQSYINKILKNYPEEKIRNIRKSFLIGNLNLPMNF
ncbi:MAG: lytic transglycosylase domain-containing protein [Candidatus Riflebacteria bacterium]|nr:lytic transglycosylase domain-containing protein [Candidatus Riflebacteria bacterium]